MKDVKCYIISHSIPFVLKVFLANIHFSELLSASRALRSVRSSILDPHQCLESQPYCSFDSMTCLYMCSSSSQMW